MKKTLELIAPAGNLEKLRAAFLFGADAVYLGLPQYSLRTRINDFNWVSLEEGVRLAHSSGKKAYVTINVIAHSRHFLNLAADVKKLSKILPDALIVSDPGIMSFVWKYWPQAKIHLSTQANCINAEAAKFWYKQGVKRIILGREATIDDIKEIHAACPKVELEYFVHGAMCMAYSGRCFLSKWMTGRSGNLGDCSQACRFEYEIKARNHGSGEIVEEENGTYILNSKDLCLIRYLDRLAQAGVSNFKIEGRAKSVYYQSLVSGAYRRAIDSLVSQGGAEFRKESKKLEKELSEKLVNRGFSTGFLLGGRGEEKTDSASERSDWEFCGQVILPASDWQKKKGGIFVRVHNTLQRGDRVEIIKPGYDIIKIKIGKIFDAKSGELLEEAHGGGGSRVIRLDFPDKDISAGSVLSRKKL